MTEAQRIKELEAELALWDGREAYMIGKMDELEAENKRLRDALTAIANTDYRGNRPQESVMAYKALNGGGED